MLGRNPFNAMPFSDLEKQYAALTDEEREGKKGDQIRSAMRRKLRKAKQGLSIRDRIQQLLHDRGRPYVTGTRTIRMTEPFRGIDRLELRRQRRRKADARRRAQRRARGRQIRAARREAVVA